MQIATHFRSGSKCAPDPSRPPQRPPLPHNNAQVIHTNGNQRRSLERRRVTVLGDATRRVAESLKPILFSWFTISSARGGALRFDLVHGRVALDTASATDERFHWLMTKNAARSGKPRFGSVFDP